MNHTVHVCLRRALVWLLLLAIPFQGVAAAGMLACAHAATRHAAVTSMPAMDHGHAQAGHCHDGGAQAAAQAAGSTDDATPVHDQQACSACAACCTGAAMAGTLLLPAAPQSFATRLIDAATGRLEAVDLALPERPPRFPLA